jgi:hypothetical protein
MQHFTSSWLLIVPLAVVLTVAACHWWYGRQRHRIEQRCGRLQADRDVLQEHVKRARQQVGQLQKELATWRLAHLGPNAGRVESVRPEAPARVLVQPEIPSGLVFEPPARPAHGFADTQPFEGDAVAGFALTRS